MDGRKSRRCQERKEKEVCGLGFGGRAGLKVGLWGAVRHYEHFLESGTSTLPALTDDNLRYFVR